MSSGVLQFQPGLSLREFMAGFGTEAQCQEALRLALWPNGFAARGAMHPSTVSSARPPDGSFSATPAGTRLG